MKKIIWAGIVLLMGCDGRLSDQQRREIREAQKLQEIKIVTDVQITETALKEGKRILNAIYKTGPDMQKIDSLSRATNSIIKWLVPGDSNAKLIENQLIEAYLLSAATGQGQENVQKYGSDSLLYTKPVLEELPDGSVNVKGMWSIWLSRKQVVLALE